MILRVDEEERGEGWRKIGHLKLLKRGEMSQEEATSETPR